MQKRLDKLVYVLASQISRARMVGWIKRKQLTISGESGDVQGETVYSWKERLPEIQQENIYNLDETGCFWRALPDCPWEMGRRGVRKGLQWP